MMTTERKSIGELIDEELRRMGCPKPSDARALNSTTFELPRVGKKRPPISPFCEMQWRLRPIAEMVERIDESLNPSWTALLNSPKTDKEEGEETETT